MDKIPEDTTDSCSTSSSVELQIPTVSNNDADDSDSATVVPLHPSIQNADSSPYSSCSEEPKQFLTISPGRHCSVDSSSSGSSGGRRSNCSTPCRSPVPPSSPQGPRFKLIYEGQVHLCRLNHTRTVISKLLSSRFLRRWETHHLILEDSYMTSRHPGGFMEDPIPYRIVQDVYSVSRWDKVGRFYIRLVIPDGSILLQVSNSYVRDQWLHSLMWKRNVFKVGRTLISCNRPEILVSELRFLVDMTLSTPLQDECLISSALNIISDVLSKGSSWMTRSIAEEVIITVATIFEYSTPTSEICDFFCWHCRENPRSVVILDIFTPIVEKILKHNMDFGKHLKTRLFVQEYILAVNCQNRGDRIIKEFIDGIHGPASICPHPRVVFNIVAICVAAIQTIFSNKRAEFLEEANQTKSDLEYINWETKLDCFTYIFSLLTTFDDWRVHIAELLQPIPFHDDALACVNFTSKMKEVMRSFVQDDRCQVHQNLVTVRDEKVGWLDIYCLGNVACDDEGDLWSLMLDRLITCCFKRRKFLQSLAKQQLGPCLLRALREDETCQKTLCALLEMNVVDNKDLQLQIITTLQSTSIGKRHYATLCEKQMHLRQLQQKGGPKKLALPSKSTDADVSRLLSSGSFGDLECLSLAFTQVTSACAEELIKLESLRYLNLWSTQFDDTGLRLLSEHLPNLQVLNLCETRVTDGGLATLAAMKSLRKLNLNSTGLSPETFEEIKKNIPVLQEVDIRYTEAWGF
ncbi:C-Maf-inducing protein [Parasteatoda tepidariorum]|uniref:C-Maf-inducing protein n=1 Tax=Parasteatoda tepidariorum TaxID=114398 RepID=UPI001C722B22|nr:C-Maf-inducing protein [Parasteatoda tepidariorum]